MNLTNLNEVLAAMLDDSNTDLDWTSLPVFADGEPNTTEQVWSWDEENAIIGACRDDLEVVPKAEIDW